MAVGIVILPLLILAVLAIGVLIYYICYKIRINRTLKGEESGAHVPMASMESVWKVVAVIAVIVMYSSLSSKITNLQNELNNTRNNLSNQIHALQYELHEMQEAAKKEASMISEVFYDFGAIDTNTDMVEMKFRVVPKSYGAETEVSLNYRGESIVLTNNGDGTFTGSAMFPMFEESYEEGVICITEGGITKTESWEDVQGESLQYYCLPQLLIKHSSFGYRKKKDSVKIEGELHIMPSEKGADQFRDLTLYVKNGAEVIEETALEDGHIVFDREYPVKDGDYFEIYVTGVDEYGYKHKQYITGWSTDGMSADVGYSEESFVHPEKYKEVYPE